MRRRLKAAFATFTCMIILLGWRRVVQGGAGWRRVLQGGAGCCRVVRGVAGSRIYALPISVPIYLA